jgi:DNA-binding NtrC family response regulator
MAPLLLSCHGVDDLSKRHQSQQPAHLLVIDDKQPIRFALKQYFTTLGYEIDAAAEREEAEALLTTTQYSVVIADLHLTSVRGQEGMELVSFIHQRWPGTRIIMLTAYGSPEIEQEAYDCGADAFLSKPQPLATLRTIIDSMLESNG